MEFDQFGNPIQTKDVSAIANPYSMEALKSYVPAAPVKTETFLDPSSFKSMLKSPSYTTNFLGSGNKAVSPTENLNLDYIQSNIDKQDPTSLSYKPEFEIGKDSDESWLSKQDWGKDGIGGSLLGAGQLGLGIMSYLDQKKSNEMNRALGSQQLAQNEVLATNKAADRANLLKSFNA